MKLGKQVFQILPGMRFQQRVRINDKWYVLTDLELGEFELEETDDGDVVETEEKRRDRHLVEFELDLFVPQFPGTANKTGTGSAQA